MCFERDRERGTINECDCEKERECEGYVKLANMAVCVRERANERGTVSEYQRV